MGFSDECDFFIEEGNFLANFDLLVSLVEAYDSKNDLEQSEVKTSLLSLLNDGPRALSRMNFKPGHITVSSWILSPCRDFALLCYHKKIQRWLQLGGHIESYDLGDITAAVIREAQEESGIESFEFVIPDVFDLDIHQFPSRPFEPAHLHFDIRFILQASSKNFICSDESDELRWVDPKSIVSLTDERSVLRLAEKALLLL